MMLAVASRSACSGMSEAGPDYASAIAEIHLTARRDAMPYLHRPHTDCFLDFRPPLWR
jgi:hypothetical protein